MCAEAQSLPHPGQPEPTLWGPLLQEDAGELSEVTWLSTRKTEKLRALYTLPSDCHSDPPLLPEVGSGVGEKGGERPGIFHNEAAPMEGISGVNKMGPVTFTSQQRKVHFQ